MPSVDQVQDISPFVQYTALATQTAFTYPFPIFEDDNLVVIVDDVTQALNTDYTVSGEGDDNGGTVTFASAMTGGEIVTIYRDVPMERLTDFQQNGARRSADMNDELDRITMYAQQLERDIGRSIRLPLTATQPSSELELSPLSNWHERFFYINSDGELEPAAAIALTTLTQSIIAALLNPQTSAELAASATPTDNQYDTSDAGDIRRYGAVSGQDCTAAIQAALSAQGVATIPENFVARAHRIDLNAAGMILRGRSRFTSILMPISSFPAGEQLVYFSSRGSSTSYGHLIENIFFQLFDGTTNVDCIGVDLGSVNCTVVRNCRFAGYSPTGRNAIGVLYDAPIDQGAYSNNTLDCDFTYLEVGVKYGENANNNTVTGGEFISCDVGVDAAPGSGLFVDTPKVTLARFEGCVRGIKEGSSQGYYAGNRFEQNSTSDVQFTADSIEATFLGGHTATSPVSFEDLTLAQAPTIIAPDMIGAYIKNLNSSKATQLFGPNVLAPLGDSGTTVNPSGAGDVSAYIRGGRLVIDNNQWIVGRNAAGTGIVFMAIVDASDILSIGASGKVDIGNTGGTDRTRVFKPCFTLSGDSSLGAVVNSFAVHDANGTIVGYVPIQAAS